MGHEYYILEGQTPVAVSFDEWIRAGRAKMNPQIAVATKGDIKVSTVFLGLNHNPIAFGPPMLFETMIFGGEHDQYQKRYSTYGDASIGHNKALVLVGIAGVIG